MAIPIEDWLRGCVHHDGRSGYVTLPTDKVHQIANYIQRTRRSGTDGLIESPPKKESDEMSEEREFATVSSEYLMELEKKAKNCEYFRGRVDGMEYVIDALYEVLQGKESE